jgi:hypothetical protein
LVLLIYTAVVDVPGVMELFILVSFMLPNRAGIAEQSNQLWAGCLGFNSQLGQGVFCGVQTGFKTHTAPIQWVLKVKWPE